MRRHQEDPVPQPVSDVHIFVFSSNRAGRHGRGTAHDAVLHHGAIHGQGEGLQNRSYAIPTKDELLRVLPLTEIQQHVSRFLCFAADNPHMQFKVTKVGCGLAGYTLAEMAPMFKGAPVNCNLPADFTSILERIQDNDALDAYEPDDKPGF